MSREDDEEEVIPDALEEAGALEADVGAHFDRQLAGIDPRLKIDLDPFAHQDLRPEMMFIREELRQAKWQTLAFLTTSPGCLPKIQKLPLLDIGPRIYSANGPALPAFNGWPQT